MEEFIGLRQNYMPVRYLKRKKRLKKLKVSKRMSFKKKFVLRILENVC